MRPTIFNRVTYVRFARCQFSKIYHFDIRTIVLIKWVLFRCQQLSAAAAAVASGCQDAAKNGLNWNSLACETTDLVDGARRRAHTQLHVPHVACAHHMYNKRDDRFLGTTRRVRWFHYTCSPFRKPHHCERISHTHTWWCDGDSFMLKFCMRYAPVHTRVWMVQGLQFIKYIHRTAHFVSALRW